MTEVWIITGHAGQWSDSYSWCQSVWTTEDLAKAEEERLSSEEALNRETADPDDYYEWKSFYVGGPFAVNSAQAGLNAGAASANAHPETEPK